MIALGPPFAASPSAELYSGKKGQAAADGGRRQAKGPAGSPVFALDNKAVERFALAYPGPKQGPPAVVGQGGEYSTLPLRIMLASLWSAKFGCFTQA